MCTCAGTHIYVKVYNVECIFFIARSFIVRTHAIKQLNSRGTLDMHHTSKLVTIVRSGNCQSHMVHDTNKLVTSARFTIKYTWYTTQISLPRMQAVGTIEIKDVTISLIGY